MWQSKFVEILRNIKAEFQSDLVNKKRHKLIFKISIILKLIVNFLYKKADKLISSPIGSGILKERFWLCSFLEN